MSATPPPSLTPLSTTAPQRGDRTTFSSRVDAFITWLVASIAEFAAIATNVYNNATSAYNDSLTASAASAAAVSIAGATKWASGTFADGDARWSPTNYLTYRKKGAGLGATDPSLDPANWALQSTLTSLPRIVRTSNTALTSADVARVIDITSGTFTQTFAAAAALGANWYTYIRNSGTGDITLDPNGSELIDGLTTYIMYPNECRLVMCDGASFTTIVIHPFSKKFSTSGNFIKPPCYARFGGKIIGAGSSGYKSAASTSTYGGGGGGCIPFDLDATILTNSTSVTVGAGGASVTTANTVGNVGGVTSFGTFVTTVAPANAYQGSGSIIINSISAPVGFEGQTSAAVVKTLYSGNASAGSNNTQPAGSYFGGAAGCGVGTGTAGLGGTSNQAGNGGASSLTSNGVDGAQPGGGGGATQTGTQSGKGGDGEATIWGIM